MSREEKQQVRTAPSLNHYSFIYSIKKLQTKLNSLPKQNPFKGVNTTLLAKQYNIFLEYIATKSEQLSAWGKNKTQNLFVDFYTKDKNHLEFGYAFVPFYRESVILRRIYGIDVNELKTCRFGHYEKLTSEYVQVNPNSPWKKIESCLTSGAYLVSMISNIESFYKKSSDMFMVLLEDFKKIMSSFFVQSLKVISYLDKFLPMKLPIFISDNFYNIKEKDLNSLSGEQLVTIALDEWENAKKQSPLLMYILKKDKLWERVNKIFEIKYNKLSQRSGNTYQKINSIRRLRESLIHQKEAKKLSLFDTKQSKKIVKEEISKNIINKQLSLNTYGFIRQNKA